MDNIKTLYEENARFYRHFLDWRHRVLLRYGIALGATLVVAKYIVESATLPNWLLPCACSFLAATSFVCFLFDRKNAIMLDNIRRSGMALEDAMCSNPQDDLAKRGGFFTQQQMAQEAPKTPSYAFVLRVIYLTSCIISSLAALALIIGG